MKKLLTILVLALALCLVCGAALALDEDYGTDPNKIVANGSNTIDGYIITSPTTSELAALRAQYHNKNAATVTIKVGYIDPVSLKEVYKDVRVNFHDFSDLNCAVTTVTPSTCFTDGSYKVKCACGFETTKTLKKGYEFTGLTLGTLNFYQPVHEYNATVGHVYPKKVKVEATCSTEGVNGEYCPFCDAFNPNKNYDTIPKTVHVFSKFIEEVEWNCQTVGKYYKVCVNCGIFEGEELGKTAKTYYNIYDLYDYQWLASWPNVELIHPSHAWDGYDGHNWSEWHADKAATCWVGVTYVRKCTNPGCNVTESYDGVGYYAGISNNWRLSPVWEVAATETIQCTRGVGHNVQFVCKNCGGAAPGHSALGYVTPTGSLYDPDDNFVMILPHVYTIANKYRVTDLQAASLGWAWRDSTNYKVPASCTEGAYVEYWCVRAWEKYASYIDWATHTTHKEYIAKEPALGHDWDEWRAVGGLGGAALYYERECKRCHKIDRQDYPTELCPGHTFEVTTAPTCENAGVKTCSTCGETEVVPALGHDWKLLVETAPTCSKEGVGTKVCNRCSAVEKNVAIEKLPHTWDAGVITKEATKEAKGEKTFTCTVCGEKKTEEVDWTPAEPAKYTMTATYDGNTVTGKLVHDDTTVEADVKNIRVTFYIEGNYYMATMAEVAADGTFTVDGVGPIVYITVAATGNTSVNPENYEKIAEPIEIIVK